MHSGMSISYMNLAVDMPLRVDHIKALEGPHLPSADFFHMRFPRIVEASTMRIEMPEKRKKYDREFCEGVVRVVEETGKPIAQVARGLGVVQGTLGNWVKQFRETREGHGGLTKDDFEELKRSVGRVGEGCDEVSVARFITDQRTYYRVLHTIHLPAARCQPGVVLQMAWPGPGPGCFQWPVDRHGLSL